MSSPNSSTEYRARIVPALQRVQREFGYLQEDGLKRAARELNEPLHRLHEVASFFPHFRLVPGKKVTLSVCRDMACHFNGGADIIAKLQAKFGAANGASDVEIKGVSCLGRCDRAVSACVHVTGHDREAYYNGRDAGQLETIVKALVANQTPEPPDIDANRGYTAEGYVINAYGAAPCDYAAVHKALETRDAAIDQAADYLRRERRFSPVQIEQFRGAATGRTDISTLSDENVLAAIKAWRTSRDWARSPRMADWSDAILNEFAEGELRGMGGAGIPSKRKMSDLRYALREAHRKGLDTRGFIVVNGDESEPGTFKDREILLNMPWVVVEGVILAGLVTGATQGFIYIRHEYEEQIEACRAEIRRAEALGVCGREPAILGRPFPVSVFVSPGGYICGEQSALIEAMSDRRGEPRNLPPSLETNGLIDQPTAVSNVETYGWMPYIWLKGGRTYASLGSPGYKGRRWFSISGDVKRPGVYEVPMGIQLGVLIHDEHYCQGMINDLPLKAFAPSGPSGGFLPARLPNPTQPPTARNAGAFKLWDALCKRHGLDPTTPEIDILQLELELDLFRALSPTGALGAGLIVYAEGRDMVDQMANSLEFYRNESCGKCVPCRLGAQKMASLGAHIRDNKIDAEKWDKEIVPLVQDLSDLIGSASICGLGRSVPVPVRTVINFFDGDLRRHLGSNGRTPHA
jgi:NADH:ubiquinone oxidoreductase subunit F (NADH-binding)/NADH:ubiquinone oxidoreductase subunit E